MPTNKTPITLTIIILIVLVLAAGGYYVNKLRYKTGSKDEANSPTSQASPTISTSTNDVTIENELNETNVAEDDADLKSLEDDINQL